MKGDNGERVNNKRIRLTDLRCLRNLYVHISQDLRVKMAVRKPHPSSGAIFEKPLPVSKYSNPAFCNKN